MNRFVDFNDEKQLLKLSFIVILLYFLPYIIFGQRSYLQVHDNMDSNIVWVKMQLEQGLTFANPATPIPQVLDGAVFRSTLYGYDISLIWFKIAGMYWGYVINKILMGFVAFAGMYYLLKRHFLPANALKVIPVGVALAFALLPFWSFTMTVCGMPFVFYAFLNIRARNSKFSDWLILTIFPFYSSLILTGFFLLLLLTVLFVYDLFRTKKFNILFFIALGFVSVLYIVSHFPLFYSFFYQTGYTSHRSVFNDGSTPFLKAIWGSLFLFFWGQQHAWSLQSFIIIPIIAGIYFMRKSGTVPKRVRWLIIYLIITSFFYGFIDWGFIGKLKGQQMAVMPLQIKRFHMLHPICWYILLALALYYLSIKVKSGKNIVLMVLAIQLIYAGWNQEIWKNRKRPTFQKFYATALFAQIKTYIGKPQNSYHTISVGMHPAIAQYNGFYTLDGYFPTYPLAYKEQFRKIIAAELNKSPIQTQYFDGWGSKCYAFAGEMGPTAVTATTKRPPPIQHLDFDFDALKKMDGQYIFSNARIDNNTHILFLKLFTSPKSYFNIYLYKVK